MKTEYKKLITSMSNFSKVVAEALTYQNLIVSYWELIAERFTNCRKDPIEATISQAQLIGRIKAKGMSLSSIQLINSRWLNQEKYLQYLGFTVEPSLEFYTKLDGSKTITVKITSEKAIELVELRGNIINKVKSESHRPSFHEMAKGRV